MSVTAPAWRGGARARSFFASLLGLDGAPAVAVTGVRFDGQRFEIEVQADGQAQRLWIAAAAPDGPAFLRADHLALSHAGKTLPGVLEARLRASAFARRPETMATLEEALRADPDRSADHPRRGGDGPGPGLHVKLRGPEARPPDPHAYADFLARHDVLCQKVVSLWLFNPCHMILHADSECFGPPSWGVNMVMTINQPWDGRVRRRGLPRTGTRRLAEPRASTGMVHVTDIRDADVITGSPVTQRAIFDHVFAKDPGPVVFFHGCLDVVAGSDVEEVYREHKARHRLPVLYFRGGENQYVDDFYRELLTDARRATPHPEDAPATRINLVGYSAIVTDELLDVLAGAGLAVGTVLLPVVDPEAIARFERAGLNVYLPYLDYTAYYDQLRERTGVERHAFPHPPFGFEGTARWLREVAAAAGVPGGAEAALPAARAPHEERWRTLVERARRHSVAIVARDFEAEQLLDPTYTYGVPVLEALLEMGFGVELYLAVTDRGSADRAAAILAGSPAGARVPPTFFRSPDEMMRLLADSPSRAVFSNFFFEWRATSSGKSTFSLMCFEAGFGGAVRTLERLLAVCETGFYARYHRYLRRDGRGRPVRGGALP